MLSGSRCRAVPAARWGKLDLTSSTASDTACSQHTGGQGEWARLVRLSRALQELNTPLLTTWCECSPQGAATKRTAPWAAGRHGRPPRLQPSGEGTGHRQLTWPWRRELARSRRHTRQSWCPTLKVTSSRGVTASAGSMKLGQNMLITGCAQHLHSTWPAAHSFLTGSKLFNSTDLGLHLDVTLLHLRQRAGH